MNQKPNDKKTAYFTIREARTFRVSVEYEPDLEDFDDLSERVYDMYINGFFNNFHYDVEQDLVDFDSEKDGELKNNCGLKRMYKRKGITYCDELS